MMSQSFLRSEFEKRIRRSGNPEALRLLQEFGGGLPAAPDLGDLSGRSAIAVMRSFDAQVFATSCLAFASRLDHAARQAWLSVFTPTIFLVGNPANLAERFAFDAVNSDASMAWLAPGAKSASGLRRLLRLFDANIVPGNAPDFTVHVPGERAMPLWRNVYVATAGLTGADYLVHLNHTLAEGVITGALLPGDELVVRAVADLTDVKEDFAVVRSHFDKSDTSRLRAYTGISTPCELFA